MSNDISGFGLQAVLLADGTFPAGFTITQFADDSDPADMPSVTIADKAMGLNGDLLKWAKGIPLPVTISVIPGSDDDVNLQILADANRVAQGKTSARDNLTLTFIYPNGSTIIFTNGILTDAPLGNSVSSSGRMKSKTYGFFFQNKVGSSS